MIDRPADDARSWRFAPGKPDYTRLEFPAAPAERPYVILNMVASADGRVTIEGTERGLGSPVDQRLMRELRVHADVVFNGAATLRASGTSSRLGDAGLEALRTGLGKPAAPIAATLTGSGDVPLDRTFFTARDFEAVVYVSSRAPEDKRAAIEATGRPVVVVPEGDELASMLRHMRQELHAELLLVEGGPTVNGQLLALGAIDELFMTLGARLVGGAEPKTMIEQASEPSLASTRPLELLSAHPNPETHEVYVRYRLGAPGVAPPQ